MNDYYEKGLNVLKEMTNEELQEAIYSRIQKNQCWSFACVL